MMENSLIENVILTIGLTVIVFSDCQQCKQMGNDQKLTVKGKFFPVCDKPIIAWFVGQLRINFLRKILKPKARAITKEL